MKSGPFTKTELIGLWRSVVDPEFGRRFEEAGDGGGFEPYTQGMDQLVRVSESIDTTTQAMFILPHSSQTAPPAAGAARALVTLTFTRTGDARHALVISTDVVLEEETTDYGELGPIAVRTGRKYRITTPAVLGPGKLGPVSVVCEAVRAGYSYNGAFEGNIRRFVQLGASFSNTGASVVPGVTSHRLIATPNPDVPIPEHVGQYVRFNDGSNEGQIRRVVGFMAAEPEATIPNGGSLLLAATTQFHTTVPVGTFQIGEEVITGNGGRGIVWYASDQRIVIDRIEGEFNDGDEVVGVLSGATCDLNSADQDADLIVETGTASWEILDWEASLLVAVTNAAKPVGGRSAMLDALGWERKVERANGENDDQYRKRVATPADVVSPNAIRRAANRPLALFGLSATLREVGLATMPGLYFDGNPGSADPAIAFAYDLDFTVRPDDRYKLAFDFLESRAFFLIEVPRIGLGDFGIAYDAGSSNAYDASPWNAFFDGYPLEASRLYRAIWQAVNEAKAGGVGFDLTLPEGPDPS